MNANYLLPCWILLTVVVAMAGPAVGGPPKVEIDPNDPRLYPNLMDPNYPDKTRPTISPEGREKLGMASHTWSGVVHPDVYARLDALDELVKRLKKTKSRDAFQTLFSMRMMGTGIVYVQVQLKLEIKGKPDSKENLAANEDAQHRVLRSLTAAEFSVCRLFTSSPGFVGYATKEALDKLAKNPDVAGVCLDDQPIPSRRGDIIMARDFLPPAKPGEAANEPGVAEGKVEADVYRALPITDPVDVLIVLREDSLPSPTDKQSQRRDRLEQRHEAERQLQERVLSTVTADDLWVTSRYTLAGRISQEGLRELSKHPDVMRIGLNSLGHVEVLPRRP